jgi:hypothetical protein
VNGNPKEKTKQDHKTEVRRWVWTTAMVKEDTCSGTLRDDLSMTRCMAFATDFISSQ